MIAEVEMELEKKKILRRWGEDTPQQSRRDQSRVGHFISWNRQA